MSWWNSGDWTGPFHLKNLDWADMMSDLCCSINDRRQKLKDVGVTDASATDIKTWSTPGGNKEYPQPEDFLGMSIANVGTINAYLFLVENLIEATVGEHETETIGHTGYVESAGSSTYWTYYNLQQGTYWNEGTSQNITGQANIKNTAKAHMYQEMIDKLRYLFVGEPVTGSDTPPNYVAYYTACIKWCGNIVKFQQPSEGMRYYECMGSHTSSSHLPTAQLNFLNDGQYWHEIDGEGPGDCEIADVSGIAPLWEEDVAYYGNWQWCNPNWMQYNSCYEYGDCGCTGLVVCGDIADCEFPSTVVDVTDMNAATAWAALTYRYDIIDDLGVGKYIKHSYPPGFCDCDTPCHPIAIEVRRVGNIASDAKVSRQFSRIGYDAGTDTVTKVELYGGSSDPADPDITATGPDGLLTLEGAYSWGELTVLPASPFELTLDDTEDPPEACGFDEECEDHEAYLDATEIRWWSTVEFTYG